MAMYQGYCGRSAPSLLLIIMLINRQMTTRQMDQTNRFVLCTCMWGTGRRRGVDGEIMVIFCCIHYKLLVPDSLVL